MSAKSQFLKKLHARQPAPVSFSNKSQADIAEFRLRMAQLQEQMDEWLVDTGLNVETFTVSVTDLLVEGGAFEIPGIVLRYDDRAVRFVPIFLYGQGVTGCVEATFHSGRDVTALGRLFMRAGSGSDWTFNSPDALSGPGQVFNDDAFFDLILALLP